MKRIILAWLGFALLSSVFGASTTKVGGSGKTKVGGSGTTKVAATDAPYTLIQQNAAGSGPDQTLDEYVGAFANNFAYAVKFTAAETTTVAKIVVNLQRFGSPAWSLTVGIYSDSAGAVGTSISEATAQAASTVGTTAGDVSFVGVSAAITSSTVYWIVVKPTTVVTTFPDYIDAGDWVLNSVEPGTRAIGKSDGTWTNSDFAGGLFVMYYKIYKSP